MPSAWQRWRPWLAAAANLQMRAGRRRPGRQRLNQGHQARKAAGLAGAEAAAWATALLNARRRAGSDVKWRRTRRASARRSSPPGPWHANDHAARPAVRLRRAAAGHQR
ncbi:Fis family transcriptional regulator [Micractinium conductrix]|uniref:Fis family transcriptional regulator n=1 Tax=Micractinium conductrix TaxID=554055 RepID=A0A2P6VF17_9CHLO|nr:Fis family transcriptional regulator [Micractinium conductrix]|eukprot:PSC72686.1 Fis family transcriptional regulator [Micractinium conductrix]